jgi:hypothetical protein
VSDRSGGALSAGPEGRPAPRAPGGRGESRPGSRPDATSTPARPARGRRDEREGVPQATLSDWEPPADDDDDRPILPDGARPGTARRAAAASRANPRSIEDTTTAVGLPDEPRPVGRSRSAATDDRRFDSDRLPQLPSLPGITEEGAPAAPFARPPREGRDARGPRDGRPSRDGRERGEGRSREGGAAPQATADRTRDDRPREPREPDARDDASLSNIFLNVGRRDGVNPEDLQKLLADQGGIPQSETSNIRVRDRITFVTVKKELADRAIKALAGQVLGGRTVVAEPARDKA